MNNNTNLLTSDDFPIQEKIEKLESELEKVSKSIVELTSEKSEIHYSLFSLYKRFFDDCRDDE